MKTTILQTVFVDGGRDTVCSEYIVSKDIIDDGKSIPEWTSQHHV